MRILKTTIILEHGNEAPTQKLLYLIVLITGFMKFSKPNNNEFCMYTK